MTGTVEVTPETKKWRGLMSKALARARLTEAQLFFTAGREGGIRDAAVVNDMGNYYLAEQAGGDINLPDYVKGRINRILGRSKKQRSRERHGRPRTARHSSTQPFYA